MDEAELRAQLAALLAEELADRIPALNQALIALERAPADAATLREIKRLVHVVKGASRSAGLLDVEAASHELETLLGTVPDGDAVPATSIEAGIKFVDLLEKARRKLRGEPEDPDAGTTDHAETSMRVSADDLDLLSSSSAGVLVARQRFLEPVAALGDLRSMLETATRRRLSPGEISAASRTVARLQRELSGGIVDLDRAAGLVEEQVRRLRLRSIGDASQGCDRIVRDAAASMGKQADLTVRGSDLRIDRAQVDVLRDVLVQLVRNAAVHGIETPEQRRATGKPARGLIQIDASANGDMVQVVVSDDGRGLDLTAISERAARQGLRVESAADVGRAIFSSGLSTASSVTELAGRGVGLDVAKQRIEALHGSIAVATEPGVSTTFTIELPTTVATLHALVVETDGVAYALPAANVERAVTIRRSEVQYADGRSLANVVGQWVPVAALTAVLGGTPRAGRSDRALAVVLVQGRRRAVILVDQILGISELAIGRLGPRVVRLRHVTGQARLGTGALAIVLGVTDVIDDVIHTAAEIPASPRAPARRRRVLVVDDSATTRALEVNILRSAGYEVISAVDGADALRQLAGQMVDLVVSDVDMPTLDGFGLAQAIRTSERLSAVPVILVTARGTDEDRARGLRAGANAYLVKSSFDQTVLLQAIERLL